MWSTILRFARRRLAGPLPATLMIATVAACGDGDEPTGGSGGADTGASGGADTGGSGGADTGGSGGAGTGGSGGTGTGGSGGNDTGGSGGNDTGGSGGTDAGGSGGDGVCESNCTTVSPPLHSGELASAGIGLVQAAIWNSASWVANQQYSNTANSNAASLSQNARALVREHRITWAQLEPTKGNVRWDKVQELIDDAWNAIPRKQSAFRIMAFVPKTGGGSHYYLAQPEWFRTAATARGKCVDVGPGPEYRGVDADGVVGKCGYYRTKFLGPADAGEVTSDIWTPNNNEDPVAGGMSMQENLLRLIQGFKDHIDTPENRAKLAWVDMGMTGAWGEMHAHNTHLMPGTAPQKRWPTPKYDYMTAMIDAWWTLSDDIPLMVNFQAATRDSFEEKPVPGFNGWRYTCAKAVAGGVGGQVAGWRNDGIHNTAYWINPSLRDHSELAECYKYGPLSGEPSGQWNTTADITAALEWFQTTDDNKYPWPNGTSVPGVFGTSFNIKYVNLDNVGQAYGEVIDDFTGAMGYKLHPKEILLPATPQAGQAWSAEVTWQNAGNTRLYWRHYAASLRFVGSGLPVVYALPGDLSAIEPGASEAMVASGIVLPAGTYGIEVGIGPKSGIAEVVPVPPAVNQAQCTSTNNGTRWCPVGSVTVVP